MPKCQLTRRQRECLEGRGQHMTAKEIGRQLNISHNTVHMHWRLARLKLRSANPGQQSPGVVEPPVLPPPNSTWPRVRQIEWSSLMATGALILAGALSLLFLLAAVSVTIAHFLSLSFQAPFYNLFG